MPGQDEDVVRGGRTVLFVSHNMQSILTLCQKAIVLHQGTLIFGGDAKDAVLNTLQIITALRKPLGLVRPAGARGAWDLKNCA